MLHAYRVHNLCDPYYWSLHRLVCMVVGSTVVAVIPMRHQLQSMHFNVNNLQLILCFYSLCLKQVLERHYIKETHMLYFVHIYWFCSNLRGMDLLKINFVKTLLLGAYRIIYFYDN